MEPIKVVKGANGQIELYTQKVIIKRKGVLGFLTQGMKGEKSIPLSSITSIQIKKAGFLTRGYIQFGLLGGNENRGGLFDATKDENTVMFDAQIAKDIEFLRDYIEKNKVHATTASHGGVADELKKFKELLDSGVITQADFDNQKKKLLM